MNNARRQLLVRYNGFGFDRWFDFSGNDSMDTPNDHERAFGNDLQSLETVFRRHRERLKRVVAFRLAPLLRRRVDESDVIQDAFVEACRKFEHYQRESKIPIFLWLRLIVNETLIDVQRHHLGVQGRDPRRETYDRTFLLGQTSVLSLADHLVDDFTPTHISMAREETLRRLQQVLENLEPLDREIIALRHGEQLSRQEVSEVLNLPLTTVAKRYVRALARLRNRMEASDEEVR